MNKDEIHEQTLTNARWNAFAMYGEECFWCGEEDNIQVHHINGKRSENDVWNICPLCEDCHNYAHSNDVNPFDTPYEETELGDDDNGGGWIKAELDEQTHEAVRIEVEQSDKPTHEVAADLIRERLQDSNSMIEAEERVITGEIDDV